MFDPSPIASAVTTLEIGVGLLILRLAVGLSMAAHGVQKLLGWFGGYGLEGTTGGFAQLGFRPARLFATVASVTEVVAGLLLALGLLGPIGPAMIVSVMIVAAMTVHWQNGFFMANNGIELTLLFAAGALGIALIGMGPYSLDALLGLGKFWSPRVAWGVIGLGVIGGIGNLALRRPPAARSAS